ncbi:MAG TPA: 2-amino-4-hydroxy-6-hydroxymethyldihydropteridine diphosphokinase [Streptosporangiaceae bacterium]
MSLDRVSLVGLRVFAHHGVLAHERRDGQEFLIDAVLWLDTRAAAAADDLSLAADYSAIAGRIVALASGPPVQLIETLAQRLAAGCLAGPGVEEVEITVHKPHAPIPHKFTDVSVTIRRKRPASHGREGEQPVTIALGSNLGDRLANLQGGLDALAGTPGLTLAAVSPVYRTAPVGGPAQPDYYNAVLTAHTTLHPRALLARCHQVENDFGRVRTETWGPRTLDLDLIVYGDVVADDPQLTLPHPQAHQRAFVLAPWHAIDPDAVIPGQGTVADLLAAAGQDGVERLADTQLHLPA